MEILIGLALLYIIQSVLIYGMTFGYFDGEYPDSKNTEIAVFMGIVASILPFAGPLLILFLSEGAKHGLRYK